MPMRIQFHVANKEVMRRTYDQHCYYDCDTTASVWWHSASRHITG